MPDTSGQEPFYVLSKERGEVNVEKSYRVFLKSRGINCVRYNRFVFQLHSYSELKNQLRVLWRMKRWKINYIDGEGKNIEKLQFIRTWEKPLGRYSIFGQGGL